MPFPEEQQLNKKRDHTSPKIKVTERRLQTGTQTWVEVSKDKDVTVMVEPHHPLYYNLQFIGGTGISDLKPDQPFHILVANFREHIVALLLHMQKC